MSSVLYKTEVSSVGKSESLYCVVNSSSSNDHTIWRVGFLSDGFKGFWTENSKEAQRALTLPLKKIVSLSLRMRCTGHQTQCLTESIRYLGKAQACRIQRSIYQSHVLQQAPETDLMLHEE